MNEVEYWYALLDEFERHLPKIRRNRGDERAARLVRDVLKEVAAAHGENVAREARERLLERWRGEGPSVREGP